MCIPVVDAIASGAGADADAAAAIVVDFIVDSVVFCVFLLCALRIRTGRNIYCTVKLQMDSMNT